MCLSFKMVHFNRTSPFVLPPPKPSEFLMCVHYQLLVEKAESVFLISSHASLPPLPFHPLLISCHWLFLGYYYCNYLKEIDKEKKNATTVSNNRITVVLFKYCSVSVQYLLFVPGYCRNTH